MSPPPIILTTRAEHWPIAGSFTISRGAKTEAVVVVAEVSDGLHRGRGECVPYARYGETVDRYIGEFERLLEEVSRDDRGQVVARTYLTSETGKVYTMLAHAAGRFGE